MDITWTVGVLSAGMENVQPLAGGSAAAQAEAIGAASEALVVAAMDRGRQEYRVTVADTLIGTIPGLTDETDVDLVGLVETFSRITSHDRQRAPPPARRLRRWLHLDPHRVGEVADGSADPDGYVAASVSSLAVQRRIPPSRLAMTDASMPG